MALDSDLLIDRRRIRRKLTFWRILAAVVAVVAIAAASSGSPGSRGNMIARIRIDGLIRSDNARVEALEQLASSKQSSAVIVHINSPGGTTAGAEQLYDALTRLRQKKPVVVVVEGLAASGGYIAALASDRIIAQQTSLVGSVGVLFQYPNVTDLLKTVGVKMEEIKSSPLKAAPNGYEPTSPEARAALDALVKDMYAWFKTMVKDRRGLDDAALEQVSDGRVFTGRQAIGLRLIDEIGDEKAAKAWLVAEKHISEDLPVRDYKLHPRLSDLSFLRVAASATLEAVGLHSLAGRLSESGVTQAIDRLGMDGMLVLWQPAG
ncbi:MAG: signal peptide peptidase SppA [Alphaproteobacteria bacterium]|nr:signal peptide peptidase SppA [Alphaproteobacteria bacterium]